ncbi:hypothetical protein ACFLXO_08060, partial [Chloroflexota bacterium]
ARPVPRVGRLTLVVTPGLDRWSPSFSLGEGYRTRLTGLLGLIASLIIRGNLNKIKNLLAVMENDNGSFFIMIEDYLKKDGETHLLRDGKLHVGGNIYTKIVLTPLMMDFGYKDINDNPNTLS